jgi:hypothetical protein
LIFYTLQGPTSKLEICEDKIRVIRRTWAWILGRNENPDHFKISELSHFEITVPKFLFFSGKLEWTTFSGHRGSFRFSTNPAMVKKIETYLQKRVIKNHQKYGQKETSFLEKSKRIDLLAA